MRTLSYTENLENRWSEPEATYLHHMPAKKGRDQTTEVGDSVHW